MNPGNTPLLCPQGATFRRTLTYKIGRKAVNLTDFVARMQVREHYDSASTLVNLTDGDGITLGGTAGTITIYISATDTSNIKAGIYVYDLEIQSLDGDVIRLLQGKFTVSPEVTR